VNQVDPLLCDTYTLCILCTNVAYRPIARKDLETNNEMATIAMQQHTKHTSTSIELLLETVLCNLLLGSCNSCTTTMENGNRSVFYVVHAKKLS
jgi:formate/nitrite transporter FocA (FNT family)